MELLVVLSIISILAIVMVINVVDKSSSAVRGLMNQVEGVIMHAQQTAMSSGVDVVLTANGTWAGTGAASLTSASGPLVIDPRRFDPASYPPTTPKATSDAYTEWTRPRVGGTSEMFISLFSQRQRDHVNAAIATDSTSQSLANSILTTQPFSTDATFSGAFNQPLCVNLGSGTDNRSVHANGVTYRFTKGFSVVIVGTTPDGTPLANGPVGVLVVPNGSANVFRYFKSGGANVWRRI